MVSKLLVSALLIGVLQLACALPATDFLNEVVGFNTEMVIQNVDAAIESLNELENNNDALFNYAELFGQTADSRKDPNECISEHYNEIVAIEVEAKENIKKCAEKAAAELKKLKDNILAIRDELKEKLGEAKKLVEKCIAEHPQKPADIVKCIAENGGSLGQEIANVVFKFRNAVIEAEKKIPQIIRQGRECVEKAIVEGAGKMAAIGEQIQQCINEEL